MRIDCRIDVEVKLNPLLPVDTITELRLNKAEIWIKHKLHQRLKELEDEINVILHQEMFLMEKEKLYFPKDFK